MSIWLPEFERRDLGPDGGPYDRLDHPKLLWHTWESYGWQGAESAFAAYPPHLAVNPRDRQRRQYVDLERHAYALAGSDTEDSWVIQLEVAGYAAETQDWPDAELEWLATDVLAVITAHVPIPPVVAPQGFHGENEGMILASPSSPIRFASVDAWDAFSGHAGHQHAPAPDEHWDPGRLDVAYILAAIGGPKPAPQEDDLPLHLVIGTKRPEWFLTDWITKRYVNTPAEAAQIVVSTVSTGGKIEQNGQNGPVTYDQATVDAVPEVK